MNRDPRAGSAPRLFFDHLADAGREVFDLFSVHLYGDVASVPGYLDQAREMMRSHGYLKPVVAGEHGGPQPFEFGEAMAVMQQVFAAAFSQPPPAQSTAELAAQAGQDTPERRAMAALYDQMADLPPTLQMFMAGCPADLEARRDRINCRQVVMRTLLALAGGVRRTAYWNLAPEYPGPADDRQMMHLLIGKLPLLGYGDGALRDRHPAADTFALLAAQLAGTRSVTRVETASRPSLYAFEVDRDGRGPLLALWDQRDAFGGEDDAGQHRLALARHDRSGDRRLRADRDRPGRRRPDRAEGGRNAALRHGAGRLRRITGRSGLRRATTPKPCRAKVAATPGNRLVVWPGTAVSTG
jgi:hypothetical protein